jgi:hypothetical protein
MPSTLDTNATAFASEAEQACRARQILLATSLSAIPLNGQLNERGFKMRADDAASNMRQGMADIACNAAGCRSTQGTRVQNALDDAASSIWQILLAPS